ncbi:hypothetical protein GCM10010052_09650 [Paenarthrobacter histidinolovorans]|nr:hypothetical protein GCM10010052_09650 [Paenarthrobacter histidinolovorans]
MCKVGKFGEAVKARLAGENFMNDGGSARRCPLAVQGQCLAHRLRPFGKEPPAF